MNGLSLEDVLTPCHFGNGAGKRTWLPHLREEFGKPYVRHLRKFLKLERKANEICESWGVIFPEPERVFAALEETPLERVMAVIIGQDPYYNGQADGLAFSMLLRPTSINNSLKTILKAVSVTEGMDFDDGVHDLKPWAKEGVLLLNSVLTVREGVPKFHYGHGWEILTDKIIEVVSQNRNNVVFLLWGEEAKRKRRMIGAGRGHEILCAPHPAAPGKVREFREARHFCKTNCYLRSKGLPEINWNSVA